MARRLAAACWLVLGGAVAAALASCAKPQTIDLTMIDDKFVPDHLSFKRDVAYRLHLENHGKETHEFTAPTFLATATIDNPDVLNREHTEVLVDPGEAKDLFFTPHRPGTYDLRCADHDWNGMVGGITVK